MRFRRWLYMVAGLFVGVIFVGAWIEQSADLFLQDGTQSLFSFYPIWLAFVAVVVVAPFALYDYLRWLFETHKSIRMRLAGVGVLGVGFWLGFAVTGWEGCVVEIDGPMDTVVSCSQQLTVGLGVFFALALASGFWTLTRRRPSSGQRPAIEPSGLSAE